MAVSLHAAGQDPPHDDRGEQPRQLLRVRPARSEGLRRPVRDEGGGVCAVHALERAIPGIRAIIAARITRTTEERTSWPRKAAMPFTASPMSSARARFPGRTR